MKQFVFSKFIEILKKYAKNPSISYQDLINSLYSSINYYFEGDPIELNCLNSNESSRIMNRQYDVPSNLRRIVNDCFDEIDECVSNFYNDIINNLLSENLFRELKEEFVNSSNVSKDVRDKILKIDNIIDLLTELLIFVVRLDNRLILKKKIWNRGKNSIILLSGDLMSLSFNAKEKNKEKIVVIPFDKDYHLNITRLNDSYPEVSIETLHGQWIKRMQDDDLTTDDIKKEIENGIINRSSIGSISKVYHNSVLFYLVGLSEFDEFNKAHSSVDAIKICVKNILEEYDKTGQGAPIYIPLLGTGRSRIGLSYIESIRAIKEECLKHKENIQGTVNIIIYTKNLEEIGDDINEL